MISREVAAVLLLDHWRLDKKTTSKLYLYRRMTVLDDLLVGLFNSEDNDFVP